MTPSIYRAMTTTVLLLFVSSTEAASGEYICTPSEDNTRVVSVSRTGHGVLIREGNDVVREFSECWSGLRNDHVVFCDEQLDSSRFERELFVLRDEDGTISAELVHFKSPQEGLDFGERDKFICEQPAKSVKRARQPGEINAHAHLFRFYPGSEGPLADLVVDEFRFGFKNTEGDAPTIEDITELKVRYSIVHRTATLSRGSVREVMKEDVDGEAVIRVHFGFAYIYAIRIYPEFERVTLLTVAANGVGLEEHPLPAETVQF